MKREPFENRRMTLPDSFVPPGAEDRLRARTFSLPRQRRGRKRKIFVVKKTSRLPSTNGADKEIRQILIFDNHPDTLRLIFGRRQDSHVDPGKSQRASSLEVITVCFLTVIGLIGMFWPLL
jgi:hypothetical protein